MKTEYREQLMSYLSVLLEQLNDAEIDQLISMLNFIVPTPHKIEDKTYLMESNSILWLRENKIMIERMLKLDPRSVLKNI